MEVQVVDISVHEMTINESTELVMAGAQTLAVALKDDLIGRQAVRAYVNFLLEDPQHRQYDRLTQFLDWHGKRQILPAVKTIVEKYLDPKPRDVIEFGPGTGWLIKGIRDSFSEAYAVDKRNLMGFYTGVKFYNVDLEKNPTGLKFPPGALIIANQFLHCVDNWAELIFQYNDHPWLVIEIDTDNSVRKFPYWELQLEQFGSKPILNGTLVETFTQHGLARVVMTDAPGLLITLWRPT